MKIPATTAALLALSTSLTALADVSVEAPWVRAMPPTHKMTAGYATLVNNTEKAIVIVGASSPIADRAELHTTEQHGDSMRMVALEPITIMPGAQFQFAPGGPHVMLMGVQNMPAAGTSVELCFALASDDAVCAEAPISRGAPASVDGGARQH